MTADRTPTEREPRTEAGRAAMRFLQSDEWLDSILAIEREAAGAATETGGLDRAWEQLRVDRGWPTPNHMRHAADALDMLVYPKYGDILRWVADLCDGVSVHPDREDAPDGGGAT